MWVKISKQGSYQIVEAIEHAQYDNHRHRGNSYADHANGTDDIDSMGTLLGKEVSPGYEKREIHIYQSSKTESGFYRLKRKGISKRSPQLSPGTLLSDKPSIIPFSGSHQYAPDNPVYHQGRTSIPE